MQQRGTVPICQTHAPQSTQACLALGQPPVRVSKCTTPGAQLGCQASQDREWSHRSMQQSGDNLSSVGNHLTGHKAPDRK